MAGPSRGAGALQHFGPNIAPARATPLVGSGPHTGAQMRTSNPRAGQSSADYDVPTAHMAGTLGTAGQAAAWRLPQGRVMPHSKATAGSTFTPF